MALTHLIALSMAATLIACNADKATETPGAIEQAEFTPEQVEHVAPSPESPAEEPAQPPTDDPVVAQPDPHHGAFGDPTDVVLVPENADAFVRPRRRMTLPQLSAAIKAATGGIEWPDSKGKSQLEILASTLGKPDLVQVVTEDLAPGPVFQKFMGDAARSVCTKLTEQELESPVEEHVLMVEAGLEDTVLTAPEKVDANLMRLLVRFHGLSVPADDPALESWRWLFQSATHLTQDPAQGWRTVCIGLISHPHFYSF